MSRSLYSLCAVMLLASTSACTLGADPHASDASRVVTVSGAKVAETKGVLRDLWLGHILSIRNVAVATMAKNGAAREAAEATVVTNAKQIAHTIEPFYGASAEDRLFTLLAGHYTAVREHLDATAAGDRDRQNQAVKQLTANAAEISDFLSRANPYWPKDIVLGLLMAHGAHHMAEFEQLKARDYAREADTWHGMKEHIYVVADALTDGLARQFPEKF